MPLAKIHLRAGRSESDKVGIADAIQGALIANLGIPPEDRFQLFCEYGEANFRHTPAFLDLTYGPELLMIELSFITGRSDEVKRALIADLNQRIVAATGQRADDVFIMIYEVAATGVSFGNGLTQRAP